MTCLRARPKMPANSSLRKEYVTKKLFPVFAVLVVLAASGFQAVARLLTVEEVAELLQVPKSWVYERTRRRALQQLPHLKLGKYLRFEESAVLEYLARQRVGATTNA